MRHFIPVILIAVLFSPAQSQVTEKHNLVYRNAKFDVFVIKIDSSVTSRFTVSTNSSRLPESVYFDSLSRSLQGPFFAITASIVDSTCNPLGLFVLDNNKIRDINNGQGNGNFYLKPNGYISMDTASKIEIHDAATYSGNTSYKYALQSGPMLITNGAINPVFDQNSKNKFTRCGVGIFNEKNGQFLVFVKSNEPVSFFQMAQLFKEKYKCQDALMLESGGYCSMHLPTNKITYSSSMSVCRFIVIAL